MKFVISVVVLFALSIAASNAQQQQEVHLGDIFPRSHGVSGKVYALDDRTLMIRNLNYDGQGPDAYFWIGTTENPGVTGTPIPDENGSLKPIKGYRNANIVLQLPANKTLRDFKSFGLYCRAFQENFGHIRINVS